MAATLEIKRSVSVSGLTRRLSGAVSARAIAADLLETHDYASGQPQARALDDESPDAERLPAEEWLNRVATLYDGSAVRELHGRLVIIGLAMLDDDFGEQASERGLITAIEQELQEPLVSVLSDEGQMRRAALSPRLRPGYLADAPEGPDLLGIANDVNALSDLIAAADVKPPLAIGLFGEWGSGKSFFMRKMQGRIEDLAAEATKTMARGGRPIHCPEVAQITFNAWQYMDANLWASLGAHLFRELPAKLPSLNFAEGRVPEVLQEPLERAEKRAAAAKSELHQAERQANELEATDGAGEGLQQALVSDPDVRSILEDEARALERRAGLPPGTLEPGEVAGILHDVRGIVAAWNLLRRRASRRRLIVLAALGILFGLVVFVVLRNYEATLAAIAALATLVLPVAQPAWRFIRAFAAVEHRRAATAQSFADAVRVARERATQASDELKAAQLEVEEIRSGRALPRVVLERLRSGETESTYRLKLGVIAGLQRDFEDLAKGLAPVEEDPPTRIVLYIDDLDRCPATLVVEVLQAIHLLLALPLFVIVVAVDPRWLLHSLEQHHAALAGSDGATPSESTAEDYLQKIIQIPFRMAPMSPDQYRRLVAGLLPVQSSEQVDQQSADVGAAPDVPAEADADTPSVEQPLPIRQRAVLLRVEPAEFAFLGELAPLVRTPRAAKRLINTYRLVRASIEPTELQRVLASDEFRAIALLLALQIRFPGRIEDPRIASVSLERPTDLLEALARNVELNGQPLLQTLQEVGMRELDPLVFRRWAPRLVRYSFHGLD